MKIAAALVAGMFAAIVLRGDTRLRELPTLPPLMTGSAPPMMLWAWEEPEDLSGIDPQRVGVAFLAERLFLGRTVRTVPRRQKLLTPKDVYAVAVVRLETEPDFADSDALRRETAAIVARAAALPGTQGLQLDFDATTSQQRFYSEVLRQVRRQLPPGIGLTMTALVSWCSDPAGWIRNLPVEAAVPMYFRLGKHAGRWQVRERLCAGDVGLSTDEARSAPESIGKKRIYLFAPRPWTTEQVETVNQKSYLKNSGKIH